LLELVMTLAIKAVHGSVWVAFVPNLKLPNGIGWPKISPVADW